MPKKSLAKKIDHFTIQYHLGDTDNENDIDGDDNNSNHGVMMILSGQAVFLRRLSRLRLSSRGLFELTPRVSLKIEHILLIWYLILQDLRLI